MFNWGYTWGDKHVSEEIGWGEHIVGLLPVVFLGYTAGKLSCLVGGIEDAVEVIRVVSEISNVIVGCYFNDYLVLVLVDKLEQPLIVLVFELLADTFAITVLAAWVDMIHNNKGLKLITLQLLLQPDELLFSDVSRTVWCCVLLRPIKSVQG